MRDIDWVVVHTSATADERGKPVDATLEDMRRYHIDHNGWDDVGYHHVVRMSGAIENGREHSVVGAHVGGFNTHSLGICCSGHGDLMPLKVAQLDALVGLCAALCDEYGLGADRVIGHREASAHGAPKVAKSCPGALVDMGVIRRQVSSRLMRESDELIEAVTPITRLQARVAELERRLHHVENALRVQAPT